MQPARAAGGLVQAHFDLLPAVNLAGAGENSQRLPCPRRVAPSADDKDSGPSEASRWLLIRDTCDRPLRPDSLTRGVTEAGRSSARGLRPEIRQTRASVLADSLLAVGPMQKSPATLAVVLDPRKLRTVGTVLTSPWSFRFRRGAAITASCEPRPRGRLRTAGPQRGASACRRPRRRRAATPRRLHRSRRLRGCFARRPVERLGSRSVGSPRPAGVLPGASIRHSGPALSFVVPSCSWRHRFSARRNAPRPICRRPGHRRVSDLHRGRRR